MTGSKPPPVKPLPPPPDRSQAESAVLQRARRSRPGQASTILTSGLGIVDEGSAARALLGS